MGSPRVLSASPRTEGEAFIPAPQRRFPLRQCTSRHGAYDVTLETDYDIKSAR